MGGKRAVLFLLLLALPAAGSYALAASRDVTIDSKAAFPESITSTAAGEVISGSFVEPTIFRAPPGCTMAEPWIHLKSDETSLGVLADTRSNALWACVRILNAQSQASAPAGGAPPPAHSMLREFDLRSGQLRANYPLPGAINLCNDITVARDGTVYISDTPNGRVFRLKRSDRRLELWSEDAELQGIDGITFLGNALYVNNVLTGKLYRVPIDAQGDAGSPIEIALSRQLQGPDGMRSADGKIYVAENRAGRISVLTLSGDRAEVWLIKGGYQTPTAVSPTGKVLWVGESKFNYRSDPKLLGRDPAPFKAYALPLP